jgi:hypothetical protein
MISGFNRGVGALPVCSDYPLESGPQTMIDLAPEIHRQRLVIEGIPGQRIGSDDIVGYLSDLSTVLDMQALISPVTHYSPAFGWAGWIHWETSGAHFYAWEAPRLFFSVDIYTCKPFVDDDAIDFTQKTFAAEVITHRSF